MTSINTSSDVTELHTDIAIIGAGISGLSCAWHLKQAGIDVVVFEKSDRVGGKIHSVQTLDCLYEAGPNTLLASEELVQWMKNLGLQVQACNPIGKNRFILSKGAYLALPSGPWSFFSSPFISAQSKFNILREAWRKKPVQKELETISEFFTRRFDKELLDKVIEPFISGIFAGNPDKLLIGEVFPRIAQAERQAGSIVKGLMRLKKSSPLQRKAAYSVAGGLEQLPNAIARTLALRLEQNITDLQKTDEGYCFISNQTKVYCNKIVLATPAYASAQIIQALDPVLASHLNLIEYAPMTVIISRHYKADLQRPLNGFGGLNPRIEQSPTLGHLMTGQLFPNRVASNEFLITSFIGGSQHPERAALPDSELINQLVPCLSQYFGMQKPPLAYYIERWPQAIPQATLATWNLKNYLAQHPLPNLTLCGNYLHGVSVPDCIESGKKLALALKQSLSLTNG